MGKNMKLGLGRALEKQHNQMIQESITKERFYRTQQKKFLESTTDINDIDTIIQRLEDEETSQFHFVDSDADCVFNLDTNSSTITMSPEERKLQQKQEESLHVGILRVPRRPPWDPKMSIEELDANEKQAFFVWRRSLASLEENEKLVVTPFEKNLDIWRQLWRVVERSDLLVMVVDARDPLFYRCPDLEEYAREVDESKRTLLLLNKADLLPLQIREKWEEYFRQHNILSIFWSAKAASTALQDLSPCPEHPGTKILGRDELLARLQYEAEEIKKGKCSAVDLAGVPSARQKVVVGFVGFPNVGKSSTINALVGQKCTGVTSTPGKTKHFQTLIISDELTLCDSPGLVFPSFSASKHDMIASGILPVDRMTDHRQALQVVADHVPRRILESVYNISLPKPKSFELQSRVPTANELLRVFCASRGSPDETKAARHILKDYVDGKLLHYELPPGFSVDDDSEFAVQSNLVDEAAMKELVLQELHSFDIAADKEFATSTKKKNLRMAASGWKKHHKKPPRKKDRSWRVGNDGYDESSPVRYFQKPVNSGPLKVG